MPDLIVNMVGKNEANRYLEAVLKHTLNFCETIVFTDDHSTDETVDIAEEYGCHVYTTQDENISFEINESILRAEAWANLENHIKNPYDTFVLALDCDELLWHYNCLPQLFDQKHYEVFGITFFHIWDDHHLARIDKLWKPNISSALFKYYPGGEYRLKKLAPGREPTYTQSLIEQNKMLWHTPLLMEHLGYLRADDKLLKYKRYMDLDGGQYHNRSHLESILDHNPQLMNIAHLCVP